MFESLFKPFKDTPLHFTQKLYSQISRDRNNLTYEKDINFRMLITSLNTQVGI